ncbi:MAG: tlde1 domain-containing protein [Acidimicrobiales bacterium]
MITFKISTGAILADDGTLLGTGYAGNGDAINDPTQCDQHAHGPLPVGFYALGTPIDRPHTGLFSIPLTPDASNQMHGRSAFYVHGGLSGEPDTSPTMDNIPLSPTVRTASDGCIVTARSVREAVAADIDQRLNVVA